MGRSDLTIVKMTNRSRGFYSRMGPFLAKRELAKELGYPIWDDDDLTWFVALDAGRVVGFCALRQRDGKADLRHSYVLPSRRRKGIYDQLFKARLAEVDRPATARSVVREHAAKAFERHGFCEVRSTKNYRVMEMELA